MAKRVLVCEDDRGIRGFLQRFLTRSGHLLDVAVDGRDCLEKITKHDYDVVLLDLMMPEFSGYDLLDRLREIKPDVLPRTIVITASTKGWRAPHPGVAAVLAKPFDLSALLETVESVLETEPDASS